MILTSKLNGKNKIQAINSCAVAILRYGSGVLEWRVVDRKTRKLFTIQKGFHTKSDVDRLYISRKDRGRGLMSCESTIRSEENNLGRYLKNCDENLF